LGVRLGKHVQKLGVPLLQASVVIFKPNIVVHCFLESSGENLLLLLESTRSGWEATLFVGTGVERAVRQGGRASLAGRWRALSFGEWNVEVTCHEFKY